LKLTNRAAMRRSWQRSNGNSNKIRIETALWLFAIEGIELSNGNSNKIRIETN